jgi:hypothetical protein
MTYNYNSKDYIVPDAEVDKLVDALNISMAEACELWLADNGDIENEEQEQANKNAQKNKRRYEQSARPRKKAEKERKIDYNKADLFQIIKDAFLNEPELTVTGQKTETELHFTYYDEQYTIKLTKHRKKK